MIRNLANRFIRPALDEIKKNIRNYASNYNLTNIRTFDDTDVDIHIHDFQYVEYLEQPDIDGWDIRRCFNEMMGADAVPHPKVIIAALKACRRINDLALTIRFLEATRDKCGVKLGEIWPYIMEEIQPTLDELGCVSPEQICWDKPELALESPFDLPAVDRTDMEGNSGCK